MVQLIFITLIHTSVNLPTWYNWLYIKSNVHFNTYIIQASSNSVLSVSLSKNHAKGENHTFWNHKALVCASYSSFFFSRSPVTYDNLNKVLNISIGGLNPGAITLQNILLHSQAKQIRMKFFKKVARRVYLRHIDLWFCCSDSLPT